MHSELDGVTSLVCWTNKPNINKND